MLQVRQPNPEQLAVQSVFLFVCSFVTIRSVSAVCQGFNHHDQQQEDKIVVFKLAVHKQEKKKKKKATSLILNNS